MPFPRLGSLSARQARRAGIRRSVQIEVKQPPRDRANERAGVGCIGASLPVTFAQSGPSIAMSAPQYERIQQKIRDSAESSNASIWLALALTFGGIAATLWVTVAATDMTADVKGKLEVGGWASIALLVVLVAVHLVKHAQHRTLVEDIIKEMDTYSYHRIPY